jgi:hypothetical protein
MSSTAAMSQVKSAALVILGHSILNPNYHKAAAYLFSNLVYANYPSYKFDIFVQSFDFCSKGALINLYDREDEFFPNAAKLQGHNIKINPLKKVCVNHDDTKSTSLSNVDLWPLSNTIAYETAIRLIPPNKIYSHIVTAFPDVSIKRRIDLNSCPFIFCHTSGGTFKFSSIT